MTSETKGYQHDPAFDSGFLEVSSIHKLHYEQYGKKDGKPVVFVHGGPGGGTSPANTVFFNPALYRVVIFDQRGCGRSLPLGEIRENQSMDLVADIEKLRKHLNIARWHVFGGSWGSTLSLLYAQTHPTSVVSLNLRGIFLESKEELEFNVSPMGSWRLQPELYEEWMNFLDPEDRHDPFQGYYKLLTSGDHATELAAAQSYSRWGGKMSFLEPKPRPRDPTHKALTLEQELDVIAFARIETHYHTRGAWLEDLQLLKPENIEKIKHIPCGIVNGRYDLLCPPIMAWRLHKALPLSKLYVTPNAGHSATEPGTQSKLTEFADEFSKLEI